MTRAVLASAPTLSWLVRLRWGAVVAETATVAVALFALELPLHVVPLAIVIGLSAASNVALAIRARGANPIGDDAIGGVLAADTLTLTAILYFSGGPSNPFSVMYLVYVTLAALAIGMRWASVVVALSAGGFALLFFAHEPIAGMEHAHHAGGAAFSAHLQSMWVAFTVTAVLIAFFVSRVARALRDRERELAEAQRVAARAEKLASLTTLAAGAAHELGTPLATIAVASKELERALASSDRAALAADARLIRDEVERCSRIVQGMSGRAGEALGEASEEVLLDAVLREVRDRAASPARLVVDVQREVPQRARVPVRGLVQCLGNLVQNAIEASEPSVPVALRVRRDGDTLRFQVEDRGPGIPKETLARIGEPFFSTKAPGKGLGLGVFLASTFAERYGGALTLDSTPGVGTRVQLDLPLTMTEQHGT